MDKKKNNKFMKFLPAIIIVMIVLIVIFALISIGKMIFSNDNSGKVVVDERQTAVNNLLSTSTKRSVKLTYRGPIVADERFRSYEVIVTPSYRKITNYKGYTDQILNSKKFNNTPKAYDEFVHALEKANFAKGIPYSDEKDDVRGICAGGHLYEFDLLTSDSSVYHLWTSTCSGSKGSLRASYKQLQSLFLKQIPDVNTIIREADRKIK